MFSITCPINKATDKNDQVNESCTNLYTDTIHTLIAQVALFHLWQNAGVQQWRLMTHQRWWKCGQKTAKSIHPIQRGVFERTTKRERALWTTALYQLGPWSPVILETVIIIIVFGLQGGYLSSLSSLCVTIVIFVITECDYCHLCHHCVWLLSSLSSLYVTIVIFVITVCDYCHLCHHCHPAVADRLMTGKGSSLARLLLVKTT